MNLPSLPFPPEDDVRETHVTATAPQAARRVGTGRFLGHKLGIYDDPDAPLFLAKEVCQALGIDKPENAYARLEEDERGTRITGDTGGRLQQMIFVTESGLYSLIFLSRKPAARQFCKWVTAELLPTLRRYGRYPVKKAAPVEPVRLTPALEAYLPADARALPFRHQVMLAERLKCVRALALAPHPSLMARCRAVAGSQFARRRGFSVVSCYRFHRRFETSGGDWHALLPQFELSGRKPKEAA